MAKMKPPTVTVVKTSDPELIRTHCHAFIIPITAAGTAVNPLMQKELERDGGVPRNVLQQMRHSKSYRDLVVSMGITSVRDTGDPDQCDMERKFFIFPVIQGNRITNEQLVTITTMLSLSTLHLGDSPTEDPVGVAFVDLESVMSPDRVNYLAEAVEPDMNLSLFDYVPAEAATEQTP